MAPNREQVMQCTLL